MATIIILTGVGAPLSMALWAIGTMPYSLAMKRKAEWQYRGERTAEDGQHQDQHQHPRALTGVPDLTSPTAL
jgi:hypothetical protein